MSKIYFYKLTADNGGAPCVANDLLSLAICKPRIRKTAEIGDLIFGFAANSLNPDNRLIYVARVTDKRCDGKYFKEGQYAQRGDCIYKLDGDRFVWKSGSLHHGHEDVDHDLGKHSEYLQANVLLSTDFRYFGKAGSAEYKSKFPIVCQAIKCLGQGHRVWLNPAVHDELDLMAKWVWQITPKMKIGEPTSKPSHSVCHRGKSCGTV
jgi:hypothetical protein